MWQPDGWDARWRVGLLVPHADVGPESEFRAMAPAELGVQAARVPFAAMGAGGAMDSTIALAPVRAFAEPPHVDEATAMLAAAPVHVIGFAFTSSAYVLGTSAEAAMIARLSNVAHGLPVVAPGRAALDALSALDVQRIALFDPPWFDAELNELGRAYYESAGLEVVFSSPCQLPSDQSSIQPQALFDSIRERVPDSAEAVVVGGNGFRAVGVIDALEAEIGRVVLTANQVLLWAALRAVGAETEVTGYGRIFNTAS